jgi:hypothetical protein
MSKVVAIHGIAQTFEGPTTLKETQGWFAAMNDGLEEAGHARLRDEDLSVVFYGSLFRKSEARAGNIPQLGPRDVEEGFEQELLTLLWLAAADLSAQSRKQSSDAEADSEPGEAPDIQGPDFHGRARTPATVQRALRQLSKSRFIRALGPERALIFGLKQVRLYLHDTSLKRRVLERVEQKVTQRTRVIVAHSLGSIIAYEALCAHPEWNVHSLITLGSPLGIPNLVFEALTPPPENGKGKWPGVVSWTNIADRGDIVALEKQLSPLFGSKVVDRLVYNGWRSHDVSHYLTAVKTGAAIAGGLDA